MQTKLFYYMTGILFITLLVYTYNLPPLPQEVIQEKVDECFQNNQIPMMWKQRFGLYSLSGEPPEIAQITCFNYS